MAKSPKEIQVDFNFPTRGLDTNWPRVNQPALTSPSLLNVLPVDLNRRARGAKRAGFSVLTGGAVGTVAMTYRQARACIGDALTGLWVQTTELGSYPYRFKWSVDEGCYYILESDAASETPTGTVIPSVQRTTVTDCEDAACPEEYPPPPPPTTAVYRYIRECLAPGGLTNDLVLDSEFPTKPSTIHIEATGQCYRVLETDPTETLTAAALAGYTYWDNTEYEAATDCLDAICEGPATGNYFQLKTCADDTLVDAWVHESLIPNTAGVADGDKVFLRYDFTCDPVYVEAGDAASTSPGPIYDAEDLYEVNQCDGGLQDWHYGADFPVARDITFADVELQTAITQSGSCWFFNVTGTLNGTHTLDQFTPGGSLYEKTIGTVTVNQYESDGLGGYTLINSSTDVVIQLDFVAKNSLGGGMCEYAVYISVEVNGLAYGHTLFSYSVGLPHDENTDPTFDALEVPNQIEAFDFGDCAGPIYSGKNGTATVEGPYA